MRTPVKHKAAKLAIPRPPKASKEEIADRRKHVLRLRMRGLGYRSIAKMLNVGHMTVKRDLDAIRDENKRRVADIEKTQVVGDSLSLFEEVELRAWQDYHEASPGTPQRQKFLDVIQSARNNQLKLLTDLGLVSKAPQQTKVLVSTEVIQHWTSDAQDLVAAAILKSKLSPPKPPRKDRLLDESKVIDVESEKVASTG